MRRWLPAVGLVAVLALLALAAFLTVPRAEPTAVERADRLARELRCPDCQGLSVADSPTSSAQEIRRRIDDLVAAGATDEEVRAHFVARYGDWILLSPRGAAYWFVPFAVILAGALALVAWLARRRGAPATVTESLSDGERRRLHEEAEALDA